MLPNLQDIETPVAGRITIGATVRSTRYTDVQGLVTAILWTGYYYSIQVDGRHTDQATNYELLSRATYPGFNYVTPNGQAASSGNFEVLLPGEDDRIYFADTAQQAIALVAATIGLHDQEDEVKYLLQRAETGPVNELRWRGQAVGSIVGQLAYVSTRQERPAPRFKIGDLVQFGTGNTRTVSGLALFKDSRNYGKTCWHYFYKEAPGQHPPMSEADTTAAPTTAAPSSTISQAVQLMIAEKPVTVEQVGRQMKATDAKKAAKHFAELKRRFGPAPTFINLAMYSGEPNDLMDMIRRLQAGS